MDAPFFPKINLKSGGEQIAVLHKRTNPAGSASGFADVLTKS